VLHRTSAHDRRGRAGYTCFVSFVYRRSYSEDRCPPCLPTFGSSLAWFAYTAPSKTGLAIGRYSIR
jgi:hypothetical protein